MFDGLHTAFLNYLATDALAIVEHAEAVVDSA